LNYTKLKKSFFKDRLQQRIPTANRRMQCGTNPSRVMKDWRMSDASGYEETGSIGTSKEFVKLDIATIQNISKNVEDTIIPNFDRIDAKNDAVLNDTKTIIEKVTEVHVDYNKVNDKIEYVSETLVEQANKEKERADLAEKTCYKVTGQLGQQAFKRRKADEANWAHLREQNEALMSQLREKDRAVDSLTAHITQSNKDLAKANENLMTLAAEVVMNELYCLNCY